MGRISSWYLKIQHRLLSTIQEERRNRLATWGAIISHGPLVVSAYFGNFFPYLFSFYNVHMPSFDPLWVISSFKICASMGMYLGGVLERNVGILRALKLAGTVATISMFISYLFMSNPVVLVLSFGCVGGFFSGTLFSLSAKMIFITAQEKKNRYYGILGSLSTALSGVMIGLTYLCINPSNKPPDVVSDSITMYTDSEILERTPNFFLLVTALYFVTQSIGNILIHKGYRPDRDVSYELVDTSLESTENEVENDSHLQDDVTEKSDDGNDLLGKEDQSTHVVTPDPDGLDTTDDLEVFVVKPQSPESPANTHHDYTTKEVVKLKEFWSFVVAILLLYHMIFIYLNLYKQYGQEYISDDSLLTSIGVLGMMLSTVFRYLNGLFGERFGSKMGVVVLTSCSCFGMAVIPVCFWLYPNSYVIVAALVSVFLIASFDQQTIYTFDLFGPSHFSSNVGLVFSPQIIIYFLEPVVLPWFIVHYGLSYVFLSGTSCGVLALIIFVAMPDRKKNIVKK